MTRLTAIAAVAVAVLVAPAASEAMDVGTGRGASVAVESGSYAPSRIAVLTGDTVTWSVVSRFHTVSADDGSWSSPRLFIGDSYGHQFTGPGVVTYYCMIHPFMHGEVDVYDVLLDQAISPAAPKRPYPLTGRAALAAGTTLSIEADTGHGFGPAGTAVVGADGTFTTTVYPTTTTTYRAVNGTTASMPIVLRVLDRTVVISDVRRGRRDYLSVRVTPSAPGSTVVLQLHLRERFGWWPQEQVRLNAASRARFVLRLDHAVPARVALTLPDGATELALSNSLRIGPGR